MTLSVADPKIKSGPLKSYHFRISDPELEIAAAALDAEGLNVYHGVGLHGADLGVHVRGTKKDVVALPGFWVDIDLAGPGHVATDLPPSVEAVAEEILANFDFEPSIAIFSGGGLHLYWLLDRPLEITDANRDELGKLSKAFQERLGALAKAVPAERGGPWRIDGTADITRILRPVGTRNHKTNDARPVEWLYPPEGCVRYPYAVLRAFLGVAAKSAAAKGLGIFGTRPVTPSIADAAADAVVPSAPAPSALAEEQSFEATKAAVLTKIKTSKRAERAETFKAILAGKSFARPGERDMTLQRVASWLAFYAPDGDPEGILDILRPSLDAMAAESPGDFLSEEQAFEKICRAQNDARAKEATRLASEARIMASVFGVARGSAGREKEAAANAPKVVPKIPDTIPPTAAAPVATTAERDESDHSPSDAVGAGEISGLRGAAVVPGETSPGRVALGTLEAPRTVETRKPLPWGAGAPRAEASTALAIVPPAETSTVPPAAPGTYYTREEIETYAAQQSEAAKVTVDALAFKKRFMIQRGESFYVYKLDPATAQPGYILPPTARGELPAALTRDFVCLPEVLPDPSGDPEKNVPFFAWHTMKSDGTMRRKTVAELIDELCTRSKDVVADMTIDTSYYDPSSEQFYEATCPVRNLKPEYSPLVAKWLELLAGPALEKLLDWIASITYLESPTCGLFIYGKASAGKSMLATGLARLWTTGVPTDMQDANAAFNADLAKCPLVVADEALPLDSNGKPMSTFKLRKLIQLREHPLRRKFMPNATLRGCIRAIFMANNEDMLSQGDENLGPDSLEAVALRFLYVPVGEEAAAYLHSLGGNHGTKDWVDGDRIARHALWLRDQRKIDRDFVGRFLVEGHLTKAHNALATSGTVPGLVVEWLARFLVSPREDLIRQHDVIIGKGRILVNASALLKNWSFVIGDSYKPPSLARVNKVLSSLSARKDQPREQRTTPTGTVHRNRYWEIKPDLVIDYADKEGLAKGDVSELWDRVNATEELEFKGAGVFGGK